MRTFTNHPASQHEELNLSSTLMGSGVTVRPSGRDPVRCELSHMAFLSVHQQFLHVNLKHAGASLRLGRFISQRRGNFIAEVKHCKSMTCSLLDVS